MLFSISHMCADTCGNEWKSDKPTEYMEAASVRELWEHLGSPTITDYWTDDKSVSYWRTPEGQGYGIWEENPEFNFEEVMEDAKAFKFGAFCSTIVSKVDVKQLSKQNSLQDIPHRV